MRGPFAAYRHEHRFAAIGDGTAMTDIVEIDAPSGVLGKPFENLVVWYLERLLMQRNVAIARAAANLD